ncbi:MAG TPA: TIM barrel protein, partial [Spirochaetia bacterium]|nr:TIM barrel protein [Spirochaetia bacterium]
MKDMEYGISTWIYEKRTLKEALQKIADIGIQCIEIWANEYHLDPRIKPDIADIQKRISSLGLWVHSIHTPFTGLNLGYPDTNLIKKWLSVVGESMEYGAELGAKIAVVHVTSFREHLNQTDQNRSIGVIREFLENLEIHARKMDMRLALENLPAAHNPSFACSIEELAKIGADEEIGFCIDIGHSSINKVDFESDIINAGSRLLSVHLSSNDGEND